MGAAVVWKHFHFKDFPHILLLPISFSLFVFSLIFSSFFFSDVFKRCPLVHLDWKILNQAWCRKCWKVKMICTQLLSIPAIFYMNQHCHSWQWQWQWLPISEEVKTNILFSCSCFALVLLLIVVFRQRVFVVIVSAVFCCCCYKCCFVCCNIWRETLNCLPPLWDVGHSNKLPT